ncbi:hypothetical protein Sant_0421 [Sodalis praecaptivus]|uniref:Uncharacterized protein n=1 Tax=Sodalis praecaptivus TaxID=1239307 RepID=W0HNV0_9GAMM|nr:hypothetical protein [Sodalis praecaptivus]AHF75526.1 hypothetical protein Sant_0421 [Sodalis praecaptivus]
MWHYWFSWFAGGLLLTNAVPHLCGGLMGHAFPTPFAKPRGRGLSSASVNVLWGCVNLVLGYVFLCRIGDFDIRITADAAAIGLGILTMGLFLAMHFGRLQGTNPAQRR